MANYDGVVSDAAYDRIGVGYSAVRAPDPKIAAAIDAALGGARTVLNVGAGTGSYEQLGRDVTAVEPSTEMIRQRPPDAAPVVQATAEDLPFDDDSFDAAMAIISDHHWSDREAGMAELCRVARERVVIVNADPSLAPRFWLSRDYLPAFLDSVPAPYRRAGHWAEELQGMLGEIDVRPVPIPHDCRDGFYYAYWRRPHAYLDERVRAGISIFHQLPEATVAAALDRLRRDLEDGTWDARYAELRERDELDVGLRLVVARVG
ncbi:MAG TPA: class I SAM-dependent methyltransferase [Thermoleophilaceae bacterium]|nr:class I SAM-dependent methyltransferase [Thermoleophilaceae bacterium]